MSDLDLADLQGNLVRGYNLPHARYLFFRFTSRPAARRFLGEVLPSVTPAATWPLPDVTTNLALTISGLRRIGVAEVSLASFPTEFQDGMAARADVLGDRGSSAPSEWEPGPGRLDVDVLVVLHASDPAPLRERALGLLATDGLVPVKDQPAGALIDHVDDRNDRRASIEHFGFADGISQPSIRGAPPAHPDDVAPGEFLLGHPDEAGDIADAPRPAALARNGSYLVYRKLEQDVSAFRRFVRSASDDPDARKLLEAQLVGRWRTGAPLVLHPRVDPGWRGMTEGSAHLNRFDYASDPGGERCPLGSHIRRANPREEAGASGARSTRHSMLRRGMPYGPRLAKDAPDDGRERGLVFLAYCADIQRQFEFVQSQWLNDGDAFSLGHWADPIAGSHEGTRFVVQGDRPRIHDLQSFVRTRGGAYLFQPGLSALTLLRDGAFAGPPPLWNHP